MVAARPKHRSRKRDQLASNLEMWSRFASTSPIALGALPSLRYPRQLSWMRTPWSGTRHGRTSNILHLMIFPASTLSQLFHWPEDRAKFGPGKRSADFYTWTRLRCD